MRNFAPKYTLINGKPCTPLPRTLTSVAAGDRRAAALRERRHQLPLDERARREPAHRRPTTATRLTNPYTVVAQTVGPGQTFDAIVDVSRERRAGTKLTVFDGNLQLRNRNRRPAAATAAGPTAGRSRSSTIGGNASAATATRPGPVVVRTSSPTTDERQRHDQRRDDRQRQRARRRVLHRHGRSRRVRAPRDVTDAAFDSPTEAVTVTLRGALRWQPHHLRARSGPSRQLGSDRVGDRVDPTPSDPASTGLSLTPNPTNGIGLGGAPCHRLRRGHWWLHRRPPPSTPSTAVVDGAGTAMVVNSPAAVTVSLDATIPAATVERPHRGHSHGQRPAPRTGSPGNWGPATSITLVGRQDRPDDDRRRRHAEPQQRYDRRQLVDTGRAGHRRRPTDTASTLVRAEGFIDTVGRRRDRIPVRAGRRRVDFDRPKRSASTSRWSTIVALSDGTTHDPRPGQGRRRQLGSDLERRPGHRQDGADRRQHRPGRPEPGHAPQASPFAVTFTEAVTGRDRVRTSSARPGRRVCSERRSRSVHRHRRDTHRDGRHRFRRRHRSGSTSRRRPASRTSPGTAMPSAGLPVVGQVYTLVTPPLYFSTSGNTNPPSVGGTADDADIYCWNGSAFSRLDRRDARSRALPDRRQRRRLRPCRRDALLHVVHRQRHYRVPGPRHGAPTRTSSSTTPAPGRCPSTGSAHGLAAAPSTSTRSTSSARTLYFSTRQHQRAAGCRGYRGRRRHLPLERHRRSPASVDASALGWSTANVDGFVAGRCDALLPVVQRRHDRARARGGAGRGRRVLQRRRRGRSCFDGTGKGLTSGNLDLDAIDVP